MPWSVPATRPGTERGHVRRRACRRVAGGVSRTASDAGRRPSYDARQHGHRLAPNVAALDLQVALVVVEILLTHEIGGQRAGAVEASAARPRRPSHASSGTKRAAVRVDLDAEVYNRDEVLLWDFRQQRPRAMTVRRTHDHVGMRSACGSTSRIDAASGVTCADGLIRRT